MQVTGEEPMPVGPKAGQPLRTLDSAYLVRALGYDSSWAEHRPLFEAELQRRQHANDPWSSVVTATEGFTPYQAPPVAVADEPVKAEPQCKRTLQATLPEELWKRVRKAAVERDVTISELVAHALRSTYPEVR